LAQPRKLSSFGAMCSSRLGALPSSIEAINVGSPVGPPVVAEKEGAVIKTNPFLKRLAQQAADNKGGSAGGGDAPAAPAVKNAALLKAFGGGGGAAPVDEASAFKNNKFLARFAAKVGGEDEGAEGDGGEGKAGGGAGGMSRGKALWQKAKGVRVMTKAKVSAEEAERIRRSKLVPFGKRYILIRWTIGWIINLTIFAILWLMNFIFGVMHGPEEFVVVLVCWGAALFQTFVIVEPSQVLALVLTPHLVEHPVVGKCFACYKEYFL